MIKLDLQKVVNFIVEEFNTTLHKELKNEAIMLVEKMFAQIQSANKLPNTSGEVSISFGPTPIVSKKTESYAITGSGVGFGSLGGKSTQTLKSVLGSTASLVSQ